MFHQPTGFIVKVEIQALHAHKGINVLFEGGLSFGDPEVELTHPAPPSPALLRRIEETPLRVNPEPLGLRWGRRQGQGFRPGSRRVDYSKLKLRTDEHKPERRC